jgi:CO/xanthine dehydrogenase FAD-binding subunit
MKPPTFKYIAPSTVDEALNVLSSQGDDVKILAGGQSLTPMLNFRLVHPKMLVDINRIKELAFIAESGAGLRIGSLSRHRTIETSDSIKNKCPILAAAAEHVAHVAIRTRGTFGGSLAHADPAAEFPMIALLLDSTINIRGPGGARAVPAKEFFVNLFTTAVMPGEILTDVYIPEFPPGMGWGFQELARRPGDFAIAMAAATVTMRGRKCKEVRISMGGVGPTPLRASAAEKLLEGQEPDDKVLEAAGKAASEASDPSNDLHGSAEFRRHVLNVLTQRALREAVALAARS